MQEVFDKIAEKLSNSYRNVNSDSDLEWNRAIYECAEIVKDVAAEYNNGWIPVSEKMPEKAEEVIAQDVDGVIVVGYVSMTNNSAVVCRRAPFITHNIVAWQPLPEKYKGGER